MREGPALRGARDDNGGGALPSPANDSMGCSGRQWWWRPSLTVELTTMGCSGRRSTFNTGGSGEEDIGSGEEEQDPIGEGFCGGDGDAQGRWRVQG